MNIARKLAELGIYHIGDPTQSREVVRRKIELEDPASRMGMDNYSTGALVTAPNQGVPAWMATYVSPKVVEILTAKRGATELAPIVVQGDWTTITSQFELSEPTGKIATYSDYSNAGMVGTNSNWETRQSYNFQVVMAVGDKEQATQAVARINTMDRKQKAVADTLHIAINALLLYGVTGIPNYGFLNDPNLLPAITPTTGASSSTKWEDKTAIEQFKDIQLLVGTLIKRSGNRISGKTPLKLACSGEVANLLTSPTPLGVNSAKDLIDREYNIEIVTIPEFDMGVNGQMARLYAENVPTLENTVEFGVNHLIKGYGLVRKLSHIEQKYSAGTFGAYIYAPYAVVDMIVG